MGSNRTWGEDLIELLLSTLRNNLTIIESILLRGESASGSLTLGNRQAGSSDVPLVLEMSENEYKLCAGIQERFSSPENSKVECGLFSFIDHFGRDGPRANPVLQKTVALRNTGSIRILIHDVSFGSSTCSARGFTVETCSDIKIEPNERYDLRIR